jgi:serine/threonine protein phosphatase PrpC
MQGWRKNMEDAHVAQLNLDGELRNALIGVFDGHNGYLVAKYCAANIAEEFIRTDSYRAKDYCSAFVAAFESIDAKVCSNPELKHEGGCTAVTVMIAGWKVVCANAGDSRAVLFRGGDAIPLSHDHKPTLPEEISRVEKAGGVVQSGRVNGTLSLTRAIGDSEFKENAELPWDQQMITAMPDTVEQELTPQDAFIVVACDGVWDVLSNKECCQLIAQGLKETNDDVGLVCEMVLDKCLAPAAPGIGCDNMSIVIAQFKPAFFESM